MAIWIERLDAECAEVPKRELNFSLASPVIRFQSIFAGVEPFLYTIRKCT
jgi:hypothetical protein